MRPRTNFWIFLLVGSAVMAQTPAPSNPVAKTAVSAKAEAQLAKSADAKVPVELEWEEVPGAKSYELEFQSLNGEKLNTFRSPNHIFKFKFRVGKYIVRSRVSDNRGVYGDWSAPTEFAVQPKQPYVSEKSTITKGKIDPKTLTSEVTIHWGEAPGASKFRVLIINEREEIVREEIVKGFYYKTELQAGIYITKLIAISDNGIESEPITLPGRVVIDTVQLPKPEFVFEEVADPANPKEKIQRLPQSDGAPVLRWKTNSLSETVGTLEYRYFFGEEWIPVHDFNSKTAKEIILTKAKKPGRYRITAWAEAKGLKKSDPTTYEFVVKPTAY